MSRLLMAQAIGRAVSSGAIHAPAAKEEMFGEVMGR